jgi:hypothetical protein
MEIKMKTTKMKLNLDLEDKYLIYASKKLRGGKSWNQFFEQILIQLVDQSRENDDELIASSVDKDVFKGLEKLADDKGMFVTDFLRDIHFKVNKEFEKRNKVSEKNSQSAVPESMSALEIDEEFLAFEDFEEEISAEKILQARLNARKNSKL